MKGVAFERTKSSLLSALSYHWLLPGVENGGPFSRPRPSYAFNSTSTDLLANAGKDFALIATGEGGGMTGF